MKILKYILPILFSCSHAPVIVSNTAETGDSAFSVDQSTCGFEVGKQPCELTLMDKDGNDWSLYAGRGIVQILDISASWCGWCMVAAKEAQSTQDKYGIVYSTILVENISGQTPDQSDLQSWANTYGLTTAPVLQGNDTMVSDWSLVGFPTFFFIDSSMTIQYILPGWNESKIDQYIQAMQ